MRRAVIPINRQRFLGRPHIQYKIRGHSSSDRLSNLYLDEPIPPLPSSISVKRISANEKDIGKATEKVRVLMQNAGAKILEVRVEMGSRTND